MKRNKFLGLGILVAMTMFVFPIVAAAITLDEPVTNTNHTGTMDVAVIYVNGSADMTDALAVNTTCYYNASGSWATVGTLSGFVYSGTGGVNVTIDISSLTDGMTSFNCSIGNDTDSTVSDTIDDIMFDSTNPVIGLTVALDGESQAYGSGLDYLCGTSDAIDSSITSTFSVAHPSGDSPSSTTLVANDVKKLFTDTDFAGDYVFTCTGTDYTGNIGTSSATVTVDALGNLIISDSGKTSNFDSKIIWLVIAGLLIWFFARKK